ncbi:hypothetical protein COLO4_33218 [Corchorus olitorius]|uniref:Reverse transcriptase zinc-binding domain-containing protein n=1 Tax=Corchorus olitorius TaxID=93759 RepID=A0A1R3GVK8_9ROSI|nr:hypothetical protein COLO4_33218 [Corchorus olitorius]
MVYQCSPKVKIFGWRLFHEIIPVLGNLAARGLEVDSTCFQCKTGHESVPHAVQDCDFAAAVWNIVKGKYTDGDQVEEGASCDRFFGELEWRDIPLTTAVTLPFVAVEKISWEAPE